MEKVMGSMTSGKYSEIAGGNQETFWKVWHEKFIDESEVHLTNECEHIFHSECLKGWYKMIGGLKSLCCPRCETKNLPSYQSNKAVISLEEWNVGKLNY